MTLTGNTRYRLGWFGRLVLQVEYSYQHAGYGRPQLGVWFTATTWRDADLLDLQKMSLIGKPSEADVLEDLLHRAAEK